MNVCWSRATGGLIGFISQQNGNVWTLTARLELIVYVHCWFSERTGPGMTRIAELSASDGQILRPFGKVAKSVTYLHRRAVRKLPVQPRAGRSTEDVLLPRPFRGRPGSLRTASYERRTYSDLNLSFQVIISRFLLPSAAAGKILSAFNKSLARDGRFKFFLKGWVTNRFFTLVRHHHRFYKPPPGR